MSTPPHAPPNEARTSGLAVASLVFGILGLTCFPGFGGLALLLGIVARWRIGARPDLWQGHGLAVAGIVLGLVPLVLVSLGIGLLLLAGMTSAAAGFEPMAADGLPILIF